MEAEKTIVMTTQVQNEGSNLSVYDVGFHLKNDLHLLEAYDMTTEAVVAKLMWILGQTRDPAEIRRLFCTPVSYDLLYLKREDKAGTVPRSRRSWRSCRWRNMSGSKRRSWNSPSASARSAARTVRAITKHGPARPPSAPWRRAGRAACPIRRACSSHR